MLTNYLLIIRGPSALYKLKSLLFEVSSKAWGVSTGTDTCSHRHIVLSPTSVINHTTSMSSAVAARNREQHTEGPEPLAPLDLGGFSMQVWSCSSSETQKQGSGFRGQGRAGLYSSGWGQTGRLLREAQCNLHLQVIASRQPEDTQRKWKVSWLPSPSLPTSLSGSDMDSLDHQFNRNILRIWRKEVRILLSVY